MVSPINYSMNVLNPIEGYMQGLKFGENILTQRQGRELAQSQEGRAQEKFALAKEDRARAIQQQQAAAAQAQAQREQAQRGQQALLGYLDNLEAGTSTPSDLRRAMVEFPQVSERFQAVASSFSQERLANEIQFGQQLSFALGRGNTDAAQSLLQERLDAATASGDERGAAAYQSQLQMLQTSPEALLTETLMPLVSTMPVDDFDKFYKLAVSGAEDLPEGASPIGKIAQDVESGLIPKSVLDSAIQVENAKSGEQGLTLQQKISEEARLRGEYVKRTEDLTSAERNMLIIETSAKDNTGAGDIALVTSFMKMLDPGSVVRETEFATAANAGGLLAKLRSTVTKIEDGKFLSADQRSDFTRLAGQYLQAAKQQERGVRGGYQTIVDNYGLNPANVFGASAVAEVIADPDQTTSPLIRGGSFVTIDFSSMEKNDLTQVDVLSLTPDQARAMRARMQELQ